jgi:maleate isomerase
LIVPASGFPVDFEFHKKVPEGVAVISTRVPLEEVTPKGLIKMGTYVEEAASLLVKAKPDIIVFACTSGSLVKGIGYDKEIIENIIRRTGISATTTASAVIEGLNILGVKRIAITTPYSEEVNRVEKSFMERSAFEVVSIAGLGIEDTTEIPDVRY